MNLERHIDPGMPELSDFIRSCIECAGGAVEAASSGRLDALLPPELEPVAGGRSLVRLALGHDGIEDGAEPAMLGSPFMDALIAFTAGRGTVASRLLPAGRLKRKGWREEVERTLLFSNCRTRYEQDEADILLSATAQFDFKVVFFSEERRERLYVVPVNLFSNTVQSALTERLDGLAVEAEAASPLPEAPMVPIEIAYETACNALKLLVAEDAARHQVRVAQRFAVEFGRISDYYDQVIVEMERRRGRELRRVSNGSPTGTAAAQDPADARASRGIAGGAALAQKIESARRERERKLHELGETYGMRIRARLSSARYLWQPKAFFKLSIDRGPTTRNLVLAHDGRLERLELPACESCRRETSRVYVSPSTRLLCPACAGQ